MRRLDSFVDENDNDGNDDNDEITVMITFTMMDNHNSDENDNIAVVDHRNVRLNNSTVLIVAVNH